ncbi:MAG: hypothetical protein HRT88_22565, partial [Lentisphaeraceae bacterium]|nr:hypothetical protein [Lentisphaeraceae bacterium]
MKYLLLSLLFIVTSLQAEKTWVQEEIILEQEDGKSLVLRISEAQKDKDYDDVIEYCDYIIKNANKPHNKARALTVKAEALNNDGEWKDAFDSYQSSIDRYPMYISYN